MTTPTPQEEERRLIVAHLRRLASNADDRLTAMIIKGCDDVSGANMMGVVHFLPMVADAIERGDHLKGKER